MKLQKKISNTLFALLLCDLPCEGQQFNVYADCIGSCIAQAVNPALIMQNENVSQKIFDVGNFYVLTLGGESENKTDSNDRAEPVQKHFYELNVSFKEIDDFKIGLHILLFLLIACVAKKTYNLISR